MTGRGRPLNQVTRTLSVTLLRRDVAPLLWWAQQAHLRGLNRAVRAAVSEKALAIRKLRAYRQFDQVDR